jgi:hypothetical protein
MRTQIGAEKGRGVEGANASADLLVKSLHLVSGYPNSFKSALTALSLSGTPRMMEFACSRTKVDCSQMKRTMVPRVFCKAIRSHFT